MIIALKECTRKEEFFPRTP